MRIAIDVRSLNDGKVTGVQVYIANLLKQLFKLDRRNEYILFHNSFTKTDISDQIPTDSQNVKVETFRYPSKFFNFSSKFLSVPKLDRLIGGADIFFFPRFSFGAVSKKCRKVITVHDISFDLDPSLFSFRRRLWHKIVSDRDSARKADELIAVSNSTKNDIARVYGIDSKKITVTPLGVDTSFYKPLSDTTDDKVKQKYQLNDDFVLTLATLEPRKNILGTLKAFEKLKQAELGPKQLVIGGNLGWLYKDILTAARNSRFKQDIRLISPVLESEKPALYRLSKILLFPSFYEGFGLPPLEAAACGTPSILAMNSSLPEVMGNSGTYINPYRTDQIVTSILELYSSHELYKEKSETGLSLAKRFSWEQTAKATLSVFDKLKRNE